MRSKYVIRALILVLTISLSVACVPGGIFEIPTAMPSFVPTQLPPTQTPLPTYTPTARPTNTPWPSPTATATQLPACNELDNGGRLIVKDGSNPAKYVDIHVSYDGIGYSPSYVCNMGNCLLTSSDLYPAAESVKEPIQGGGYAELSIYIYFDFQNKETKVCLGPEWVVVTKESAP